MINIQIILYKSAQYIPSLVKGSNDLDYSLKGFKIHFLENSSEENGSLLEESAPSFSYTYDKAPSNLGFGKGHNYIFEKYGKDYGTRFIVLNPDIIPFFDFLNNLESFQKEIPKNWGIIELTQFTEEHPKDYDDEFKTEYASAAAAVYKTSAFRKVNGFDNNIFMYAEDVDISWRIREEGYGIFHCPTAKILHAIGASTRDATEILENKNSEFQTVHSLAGNLYLRYKFFGEKKVREYTGLIKNFPEYDETMKLFEKMKKGLNSRQLKKYRAYKTPKIYPDTNYAEHRW